MLWRITSPSLRTKRLVDTPTLAVCGAIGFPTSAPTELNDGRDRGGRVSKPPRARLARREHRVGRRVAARQRDAHPPQDRREDDEREADLRAAVRHRVRHAAEDKGEGETKDEEANEQRAPHLMERAREDLAERPGAGPQQRENHQPRREDRRAAVERNEVER